MIGRWIKWHANSHNKGSLTNTLRKKRMEEFELFFYNTFKEKLSANEPIRILDIGGTVAYWKALGFRFFDKVDITLANLEKQTVPEEYSNIRSIIADGTNLIDIKDQEFDLVFSNSCIEHVGDSSKQSNMAKEIYRVSAHFYLQTPNYYFPIEPHFLFPFFQFFPISLKTFLIYHFQLGFWPKGTSKENAREIANGIKLLRYRDLKRMFPNAIIKKEKFCGMTKSFMVFG